MPRRHSRNSSQKVGSRQPWAYDSIHEVSWLVTKAVRYKRQKMVYFEGASKKARALSTE
jgi:hypothetical protein